jgi:hypothetical protein
VPPFRSGRPGRRFRHWLRSTPTPRVVGVMASVLLLVVVLGVVVGVTH